MEATKTRTPDQTLEYLRMLQGFADAYVARGDRGAIEKAGKNLAEMVVNPENAYMANGLAAILEHMRGEHRRLFGSPVAIRAEVLEVKEREIPTGTFTVVRGTDGSEVYETVKIELVKEGPLEGKLIASHISGPDNENDFQGFAFVTPQGRVNVWKRHANIDQRWVRAIEVVVNAGTESRLGMAEAYALRSGRCSRCGRKLTVPASLHRGYGPDCAAIVGVA